MLTQLFSYEVPIFVALLAPALLADTWSLSGMTAFYAENPLYILINIPAFVVAIIASQGKLERIPFDIPEAETEIVHGAFVEYTRQIICDIPYGYRFGTGCSGIHYRSDFLALLYRKSGC